MDERSAGKSHTGRAFAPGHLTGFFLIADTPLDPMHKGSLGAGICLSKGAASMVTVTKGKSNAGTKTKIKVKINGVEREAKVTTLALQQLVADCREKGWILKDDELEIRVDTTLGLPEKSGWGMSGAGALSSVLALKDSLNLPLSFYQTASFAHLAEIEFSTGLGDVIAQCTGGFTVRKRPGLPPFGFVDKIPVPAMSVVCLTLPNPLSTSEVLHDPEKRKIITAAGRVAVDGINWLPSVDMFLEYSKKFTESTGFASEKILDALRVIEEDGVGRGGMAMLGNSLFAIGETEGLVEVLSQFGRIDVCDIDFAGARVIKHNF